MTSPPRIFQPIRKPFRTFTSPNRHFPRAPRVQPNPMPGAKGEFEATGGVFVVYEKPKETFSRRLAHRPGPARLSRKKLSGGTEGQHRKRLGRSADTPFWTTFWYLTPRAAWSCSGCGHSGIINTLHTHAAFSALPPSTPPSAAFISSPRTTNNSPGLLQSLAENTRPPAFSARTAQESKASTVSVNFFRANADRSVGTIGGSRPQHSGIKTGRIAQ